MAEIAFRRRLWFGPAPIVTQQELGRKLEISAAGRARCEIAVELLKMGVFSVSSILMDQMRRGDRELRNACWAVLCAVARHQDIELMGSMLDADDEEDVKAFALYSVHTLSVEVLPHLLALLELWEGTWLEERLRDALSASFPLNNDLESVAELGEAYAGFVASVDRSVYYFGGNPVFAGDLTRVLLTAAADSMREGRILGLSEIPMLLSVWSGVECPVGYSSRIDDHEFGLILEYVKQLSRLGWLRGAKYFYGHRVL